MMLSPPLLARWSTSLLRIASAMRTLDFLLAGAALCVGILASIVLVHDSRCAWGAGLAVLMVAIAAIDARRFIIPDELTAAALALGLAYAAIGDADVWQALAWAVLRGAAPALAFLGVRAAYRRWRGLEGIGLGDVKLAGVAGVWLDWPTIPIAVEIAALAALGAYMIRHLYVRRDVRATTRLPFGLFLAPAIWIAWLLDATLLF